MKQILKNGMTLNYQEQNPTAQQTIVFLHGNSHSHQSFIKQTNSPVFKNMRLILVDLPGHGDSSRMENYTIPLMAECIAEFIKIKKLNNYIIVGHSLGGHIAIHTLNYLHPAGLFIYGTPPSKKPFDLSAFMPNPNTAYMQAMANPEEIEAKMLEFNYDGEIKAQATTDYFKADPKFRTTIFTTIVTGEYFDEVELLNNYQGELHVLIAARETIANNQYIQNELKTKNSNIEFSFIDSAHSPHIEQTESFNASLLNLTQLAFSATHAFVQAELS